MKRQQKALGPTNDTEARDILRRFVIRARRVEAHSLVQNQSVLKYMNPSFTLRYKEGYSPQMRYIMPEQEIFESLAARTRPCILESEPVYLDKVFRSIEMLLGDRQLAEDENQCLQSCQETFHNLRDKNHGKSYTIQRFDKENVPESEPLSDLLIGEAWLYSDLVHADPKGNKAKALNLSYRERYFAGTAFFSTLAVLIVNLLKMITVLDKQFKLNIDKSAWEEQVVATEEDLVTSLRIMVAPVGTIIPADFDLSAIPGAVDVSSFTEMGRLIHPERSLDVVFLHGDEVVHKAHAVFSLKNSWISILIADALIIEFNLAEVDQTTNNQLATTSINYRFTAETVARNSLLPIIQKSERISFEIPNGKTNILQCDFKLKEVNDGQNTDKTIARTS